ncbi:ral GTPase-activating protein subunit alpha-1-like isoform X2 [Lineus longissimus]|uniref:ral GTPase-activating protein subunit alpha-1-like isoform X2 n=1 Tax=Lineus longissimus TaxID=88925 RepID=UPI00315C4DFE
MFSKKQQGDIRKSSQKVLDPKKDTVTRLKHLRILLDNYDVHEAKKFFELNYSSIYYVFYDVFIVVESDIRQRASKAHKEMDAVLFIFEKILILLPELIHKRWQFHSVGRLLKKLLHTGNTLKLRVEGMKLFLIWYQILQENATKECHMTFASLVPRIGLEDGVDVDLFTVKSNTTSDSSPIVPVEITAMQPIQAGEKLPDNITRFLLESLMNHMVSEVTKIEWENKKMQEFSFNFLFNYFKKFYLNKLFPDFSYKRSIYEPNLDLPEGQLHINSDTGSIEDDMGLYQEVLVKWMTTFTHSFKKQETVTSLTDESSKEPTDGTDSQNQEHHMPGSKESTLSATSTYTEKDSNSSICLDDHSMSEYEIVKHNLFSTRENINIVHEMYRQAFHFPFQHSGAIRRVIQVYRDWLQSELKPIFMQEPVDSSLSPSDSPSNGRREPDEEYLGHADTTRWYTHLDMPFNHEAVMSSPLHGLPPGGRIRTNSYLGAMCPDSLPRRVVDETSIEAGAQKVFQVFITNSAVIFLRTAPSKTALTNQVDMCKRVLNIYRYMVMNLFLERQTWEQLLLVLLRITSGVLKDCPPADREASLGGRLAQPLFQTLIVTWIKANLNVYISMDLWDQFLAVLSSLTQWEELIKEWAKTMETLTRVLARQVYSLDLSDLPLDRLSEQKEKRRRGVRPHEGPAQKVRARTFSRGWSRSDSSSGMTVTLNASNQTVRMNHQPAVIHEVSSLSSDQGQEAKAPPVMRPHSHLSSLLHDHQPVIIQDFSTPQHQEAASEGILSSHLDEGALDTLSVRSDGERARSRSGGEDAKLKTVGSDSSTLALIQRSSSDSNLVDLSDRYKNKGANFCSHEPPSSRSAEPVEPTHEQGESASSLTEVSPDALSPEDNEIASLNSSLTATDSTSYASVDSNLPVPYAIMDQSADSRDCQDSAVDTLLECMENEVMLPESQNSSPRLGSRNSSPMLGENDDLVHEELCRGGKGSPTPDRESIHIDVVVTQEEDIPPQENQEDCRSVLAGGTIRGWTPDVTVVLWRRMLGSLGDINDIKDPAIHASVYEYLCELMEVLIKIRDNLSVTSDNQSSPAPPEIIPPLMIFSSWLFKALTLSDKFKKGKLLAYRLLCVMTIRQHDIELPNDHLAQFYRVLHHGLVSLDQDVVNVLVKYCGPRFLAMPMQGSTMLILDFIHAANTIAAVSDLKEFPRTEAVSILGALLCFPNHLGELTVLEPNQGELSLMLCNDAKDHLIGVLLKLGKKEPAGLARCIAVSSLGMYLYEELKHGTMHSRIKEAIHMLLLTLRAPKYNSLPSVNQKIIDRAVAQVACDMLVLLCDHVKTLLQLHQDMPKKIIEAIATSISSFLPSLETSGRNLDKEFVVSLIFCLLDWCMNVPLGLLMDAQEGQKPLIYTVFKVLNQAVLGVSNTMSKSSLNLMDMVDYDLETIRDAQSGPTTPRTPSDHSAANNIGRSSPVGKPESDIVKLAARTMIGHLVNHLGLFPKGGGAARLNSSIQEFHDSPEFLLDELKPEIFELPNVQFFVLNNNALVSFIEIPALLDVPGGGVTAGLTTGKTVTRVIIRDVSGKYCWDSAILYGPPNCRAGSYFPDCNLLLNVLEEVDNDLKPEKVENLQIPQRVSSVQRKPNELPQYETTREDQDNLNDLLQYIGCTSKECHLNPGEPLNIPESPPEEISPWLENHAVITVQEQRNTEVQYNIDHKNANSMIGQSEEPMPNHDPVSPFQLCRMMLCQLGFMAWEKRATFDLLKKNDKLLRELKNLDNQWCRETHKIAVLFVAAGQEDKQSILNNAGGSKEFEEFVAGLGWEVDLENHCGFRGGLNRNKTNGDTAPYFATSWLEVIFHVSTRMPSETNEDKHKKMKHLGNDEVQIIWSEHDRDYRRGMLPTEFGDVLIIIYPLINGLFRIQINRKPEVPYFGPLFDGAIVGHLVLPGLVRATAINASRMKRSQLPYYQSFYEERAKYLDTIVNQHKEATMYEDFAEKVFAPVLYPVMTPHAHKENILPGTPFSEVPSFIANYGNNGGEHKLDKHSPHASSRHGKGTTADEGVFLFPPTTTEKSLVRRLSFRSGRKSAQKPNSPSSSASPPESRR